MRIAIGRYSLLVKILVGVLLSLSLGLNLVQRAVIKRFEQSTLANSSTLRAGTPVADLEVVDTSGAPVRLQFRSGTEPSVVYVFGPACIWCARGRAAIKMLAAETEGKFKFMGVSTSPWAEIVRHDEHGKLGFPCYGDSPVTLVASHRLDATPQLIVIGPDGRVERAWLGAITGANKRDIEEYFSVTLPELDWNATSM